MALSARGVFALQYVLSVTDLALDAPLLESRVTSHLAMEPNARFYLPTVGVYFNRVGTDGAGAGGALTNNYCKVHPNMLCVEYRSG